MPGIYADCAGANLLCNWSMGLRSESVDAVRRHLEGIFETSHPMTWSEDYFLQQS